MSRFWGDRSINLMSRQRIFCYCDTLLLLLWYFCCCCWDTLSAAVKATKQVYDQLLVFFSFCKKLRQDNNKKGFFGYWTNGLKQIIAKQVSHQNKSSDKKKKQKHFSPLSQPAFDFEASQEKLDSSIFRWDNGHTQISLKIQFIKKAVPF